MFAGKGVLLFYLNKLIKLEVESPWAAFYKLPKQQSGFTRRR